MLSSRKTSQLESELNNYLAFVKETDEKRFEATKKQLEMFNNSNNASKLITICGGKPVALLPDSSLWTPNGIVKFDLDIIVQIKADISDLYILLANGEVWVCVGFSQKDSSRKLKQIVGLKNIRLLEKWGYHIGAIDNENQVFKIDNLDFEFLKKFDKPIVSSYLEHEFGCVCFDDGTVEEFCFPVSSKDYSNYSFMYKIYSVDYFDVLGIRMDGTVSKLKDDGYINYFKKNTDYYFLKSDGVVVILRYVPNKSTRNEERINLPNSMYAVDIEDDQIIGVNNNGTLYIGKFDCMYNWRNVVLFKNIANIDEERKIAFEDRKNKEYQENIEKLRKQKEIRLRLNDIEREIRNTTEELNIIKGLFKGSLKQELRNKIDMLTKEKTELSNIKL